LQFVEKCIKIKESTTNLADVYSFLAKMDVFAKNTLRWEVRDFEKKK